MLKSKLLKSIVIGVCLTILPSSAAFAGTEEGQSSSSPGQLPVNMVEEVEIQPDVLI